MTARARARAWAWAMAMARASVTDLVFSLFFGLVFPVPHLLMKRSLILLFLFADSPLQFVNN